ncbi:DUF2142 domain-containing protein [Bordetella genomosp. 10]|uniref:DUF2142 domain-containing protein n=1 Tax=Bordetella genomosp. 10 TaxID=1416804 RepID=UPI0015C59437|nr:DUF2142 domain-containing protein [Bordetella genomosp. 10]
MADDLYVLAGGREPARRAAVPARLLILLALACGILLNALIPPGQSPDEESHLARSYLLSMGQILLDRNPGGSGGAIDDGLLKFDDIFHAIGVSGKLDAALMDGVAPNIRWTGTRSQRSYAGTGYYFPVIYLPQALALAISRALNLSIAHSYTLARAFVFLTTLGLIVAAGRLVTPSSVVLALLAMPMVIFQSISTTIDGLALGLCMLALSCFMALLQSQRVEGERGLFLVMCIAVFILAGSRAHALPMILLPFVVAWHRRSRQLLLFSLLVLVLTLAWTSFALITVQDPRIPREVGTSQVLRYYLLHPFKFLGIVGATLKDKWAYYRDTFIGTLGYLDVYLPAWYESVAFIVMILLGLVSFQWRNQTRGETVGRIVLAIGAVGSCVLVFLALLATWTPFPSTMVDGVQGRYFHIPAMMLAYAVAGSQPLDGRRRYALDMVLIVFFLANLGMTADALLSRYWVPERNYREQQFASAAHDPVVLSKDNVLSGEFDAPANGSLYSVAFNLGTYFGRANGDLQVEVCGKQCVRGRTNVALAVDNRYAYLGLDKPLLVTVGESLQLTVTMSSNSTHPVVLWAGKGRTGGLHVKMNGQAIELAPDFLPAVQ